MPKLPFKIPFNFPFSFPTLSELDPSLAQALLIFVFVFTLALLIGLSRHYLISMSLKGVWAGFITGIIVVLILEGVVFWGANQYIYGEKAQILPENIRLVLENSSASITKVLGIKTERKPPTAQSVISDYDLLSPLDTELVTNSICKKDD